MILKKANIVWRKSTLKTEQKDNIALLRQAFSVCGLPYKLMENTIRKAGWLSAEAEGPYPKFGLNVKIDDAIHTPIEHKKVCYLHNGSLWVGLSSRTKMDWESKERWLGWIFIVVSRWGHVRVCEWKGPCIVWISCCSQRNTQTFLSTCPDVWQKEKMEGWGIKATSNKTFENGVRFPITKANAFCPTST